MKKKCYVSFIVLVANSPAPLDLVASNVTLIIIRRWLVKRGRDKEALAVLTGINKHDSNETFVDTCLQLKELQATTTADQSYSMLFKELFHWKCR